MSRMIKYQALMSLKTPHSSGTKYGAFEVTTRRAVECDSTLLRQLRGSVPPVTTNSDEDDESTALAHAPFDNSATWPHFDQGGAVFMPPDSAWLAVEPLEEEDFFSWAESLDPVNPDHDDAAASETSRPTSPSLPPSQPAPVLLSVAPIAEDYEDQFELTPPPSTEAVTLSCNATRKGEKLLRPKELTQALRYWLERHRTPYATLEEKNLVAGALNISVAQVTNFCNNYRKRFSKVGDTLTSYRKLAFSQ
ncbi:hypothetical protein T484DRAFT_1956314 [Baffinella frigidus]|nr:hypothetical protein T484DRAFT_1956314 [Cryptophyta sp. CCMP2293]